MKEYIYPKINGIYNEYSEYGYVIIRNALSKILINDITRHIDWLMEKNPDLDPENLGYWLIPKDPFWIRFLSETSLLNIAGRIIGPNIALFAADYLCKPPFIGKGVRWHQDAVYWPLEPMNVITLRFAVTEENTENGCVRMIPGSHKLGTQKHDSLGLYYYGNEIKNLGAPNDKSVVSNLNHLPTNTTSSNNILDQTKQLNKLVDGVDIQLNPGDVSVHSPFLIHGSISNKSNKWRKGGCIQYMPVTTKVTKKWPCIFLLKGNDLKGVNKYQKFPKYVEGKHMYFDEYVKFK